MSVNKLFCLLLSLFGITGCPDRDDLFIQTELQHRSDVFTISVNSRSQYVESYKTIHYVDFTLDQPSLVTVGYHGNIDTYKISPLSRNIQGKAEQNSISFKIDKPGYYVVEVNDTEMLAILANSAESEEEPPVEKRLNILDYVPDNRGDELYTARIQQAINDVSGSGKILYFPPGVYRTGTLVIGSNTEIYLGKGAVLKGSENRDDYPADENRPEADHLNNKENYTDNGEFMTFSRLLLIDNARNVRLYGRGIIDGSGNIVRAQGKPANLIRMRRSKNIVVENLILRDPAAWNTHIQYCENVTIRNVKILNDPEVANTDGIDPDASVNVLVEHCFAFCSDDNIAIKTTNNLNLNRDLENITVKDCVFLTRKSALKVGTETKAQNMRNILFENNDILLCDRGLVLYNNDGSHFDNIRFVNNRFEKNYPDNQRKAIHFQIRERHGRGMITNVLIKDCKFYTRFPNGSEIKGLDDDACIDGILFENLTIEGSPILSPTDGNIRISEESVKNVTFN